MTAPGALLGAAAQAGLVVAGAPLLTGLMRAVRAHMVIRGSWPPSSRPHHDRAAFGPREGRGGGRVTQPWRDIRKLIRKEPVSPPDAGPFFRLAPPVLVSTSLFVAAVVPLATTSSPAGSAADLIVVVGLLFLGTAALALAALDTGTAFGGMGASRAMTIAALVEPTLLLAVFALSTRAGSTNLGVIVEAGIAAPETVFSPASLLAAVALLVAVLAEAGRLPVDNPSTHLELTMVHEAMVLEYSGRDLALVELAASMRLALLLGLIAKLFLPWGITVGGGWAQLGLGFVLVAAEVAVLAVALAAAEVFLAKLRLFRVPELLAGSFVLALMAVTASFVLA